MTELSEALDRLNAGPLQTEGRRSTSNVMFRRRPAQRCMTSLLVVVSLLFSQLALANYL